MSKNHHKRAFNEILASSIDEALASLGESIKTSIYYHLEKEFRVQRQNILYDINSFSKALECIFGLGAKYIEILIIKILHERVSNECGRLESQKLPVPELSLQKSIEQLQLYYEEKMEFADVKIMVDAQEQNSVNK